MRTWREPLPNARRRNSNKRKARRQCNRQDGYQGFGQLIQNQVKNTQAVNQTPTSKARAERANALEREKKTNPIIRQNPGRGKAIQGLYKENHKKGRVG